MQRKKCWEASITYKLKLNGGDIKAVQGGSGHAQAKMVTDQYSHIIDEDRKHNAELFEQAFYEKKGIEDEKPQEPEPAAANESFSFLRRADFDDI